VRAMGDRLPEIGGQAVIDVVRQCQQRIPDGCEEDVRRRAEDRS
jgi:hypothetical protein